MHAIEPYLILDDGDWKAVVEQAGAAAQHQTLSNTVGEADAGTEVVVVVEMLLKIVAEAVHQRQARIEPQVVLDEHRPFPLPGIERRDAAADAVVDRLAGSKIV